MKRKDSSLPWIPVLAGLLIVAPVALIGSCALAADPAITIVMDRNPAPPAAYGMNKLMAALREKAVAFEQTESLEAAKGATLIVCGVTSDSAAAPPNSGAAAQLLKAGNIPAPAGPEALVIRHTQWRDKSALLICGSDARGLMYAELDVVDRIGWSAESGKPLSEVKDATEKPAVSERALSLYTMNRAYWESRFYDEKYWSRYLDMLAQNRFNSFVVIFGYENGGFLAPPYPYFFDTDEFPDVRMVGITAGEQKRNLDALNRLIRMAHDRGINVTLGIWDHIYRGGVQGGGVPGANDFTKKETPGLVWGVTEKNLTAYTKAALAKFIHLVPDVNALQFRMHDESGLKKGEQEDFWKNIFQVVKTNGPKIRFDARAKGLPDSVIEDGLNMGVNLRITTKYWMEQMGLPFHPTHINKQNQNDRRHSYADLLRYPQRYNMHWRLWNGGTSRVLLWGDPEFARRFAESSHLYGGDGYEVNEPLATKMEAQPHDMKPFDLLTPQYRYYDYEFERYWHFFQVFGRMGYNPNTPPEVWQKEFELRFGKEAAPHIENALHKASWILPRIVASCYPYGYFPMTRGWAEKQRLGDLPAYAKAEGSDIQIFASFDEEAANLLEKKETAKVRPLQTSRWFAQTAHEILREVDAVETGNRSRVSKERDSTIVDLRILANLALFHARRIPAAVSYDLFKRAQDPKYLNAAIASERSALEAWKQLVAAAGGVYAEDLMMGARRADLCGHWKDELAALEKGLADLEKQRQSLKPAAPTIVSIGASDDIEPSIIKHRPIASAPAGKPIVVTAEVSDPSGVKWVRLRYRGVNQRLDYETLPMAPTDVKNQYQATVPAEQVDPKWDFMYLIEAMDTQGNGTIYPNFEKETPYIVVKLMR
ncbi:MAG: hypothetical protein NTX50_26820 [Candidatus Sumerlaeota bacterium]|nr:hypothetical protein [Candidatus Sumerlaeota bacterium]